jgi:hypothetical protein
MASKLVSAMALQFLNLLAAGAICVTSFWLLPKHFVNYQAANFIVGMIIVYVIMPCFALLLSAALAYLQYALYSIYKAMRRNNLGKIGKHLIGSLIALFVPSLIAGFVELAFRFYTWEWIAYPVIALMMLVWASFIVRIEIWREQPQSEKRKNSL